MFDLLFVLVFGIVPTLVFSVLGVVIYWRG